MNNLATIDSGLAQLEKVLISGDLSTLKTEERVIYYRKVCDSLALNPLTKPFEYIKLNNKLTLYAKRDCTDQLRKIHGISIEITNRENVEGLYIVTAKATDKTGRVDEAIGAVPIEGKKGEALANAIMKTETKAKRRVTLSLAGLGMFDETELETVDESQTRLPNTNAELTKQLEAKAKEGTEALKSMWEELSKEDRLSIGGDLNRIKQIASEHDTGN